MEIQLARVSMGITMKLFEIVMLVLHSKKGQDRTDGVLVIVTPVQLNVF